MTNDNRGRKPNNVNENIDDEILNLKDQIILNDYSKYKVIIDPGAGVMLPQHP
jgi:dihydropteroate synthase